METVLRKVQCVPVEFLGRLKPLLFSVVALGTDSYGKKLTTNRGKLKLSVCKLHKGRTGTNLSTFPSAYIKHIYI